MNKEREAIKRVLDRIERWKMGLAGEELRQLAYKIDYWLIDDEFREMGGYLTFKQEDYIIEEGLERWREERYGE